MSLGTENARAQHYVHIANSREGEGDTYLRGEPSKGTLVPNNEVISFDLRASRKLQSLDFGHRTVNRLAYA